MPIRKSRIGAAVAAALLFAWLARWVSSGESLPFDTRIRDAVHVYASPLLTWTLWAITMLGSELVMLPLGAVVCWRLTATGHGRKAILLAGGTLSAQLFSAYLKMFFHRVRPTLFFTLPLAQNYSFPSGHAFVGTVFYGLLAGILLTNRARRIAIVVVIALLIGLSRVYLGYHYPSDVFAGWACAIAWISLAGAPIDASRQPQK